MKDKLIIYLLEWCDCGESDVIYVGHDFIAAWENLKQHANQSYRVDDLTITSYLEGKWVETLTSESYKDTLEYTINTKK